MMKKAFVVILIVLTFIQCAKDENSEVAKTYQDYIIAGDSTDITQYILGDYIEFLTDGDTIPDWFAGSTSDFIDSPIDIDKDNEFDIRYGAYIFLTYNILIYKALYFKNNYGNLQHYEFAILARDTIGMNNDTIKFARLFETGDTISSQEHWYSTTDPGKVMNQIFISYYYDYEFHNSTIHPNDNESIEGKELYFNKSGLEKYVGIRKKVKR
ncbi:MAG: hypothetical protein HC905_22080 [Bacteroidales bacterium]|nr:hypothetical protein [Bacteroidales bacterium]